MEIVTGILVCLIPLMNSDNKENGGKKAFLSNSKNQYRISQCGEYDCHANNKNNGYYYEYPSLSHLMNEL